MKINMTTRTNAGKRYLLAGLLFAALIAPIPLFGQQVPIPRSAAEVP